jgi:hypothetical protein
MKLSEDQMGQLLSAFWIQANLPDNLPSNIEAIAHSFILALIVLRIKVVFFSVHIHIVLNCFCIPVVSLLLLNLLSCL